MAQIDRSEGLVGNTGIKAPVRAATTANIALSGEQTIDGIACVTGDRVLVKDQTTGSENGIYVVSTGSWERSDDFDGPHDVVNGTLVLVNSGTVNADAGYTASVTDPVTIGTSTILFDLQSPDSLTNLGMSSGSSLVGFIQSGTGATARTVQAKMRDVVSVKDFGAVGDGVTDDTAAIQAAIDSITTQGVITFPPAIYSVSGITLPTTIEVSLEGWSAATLKARSGTTTVLTIANDITRGGYRSINGITIDGNSVASVVGIKTGNTTSAALYLSLQNVFVKSCAVGIDLYTAMEHTLTNVTAYSNTIGLKLRQDSTNGGGNANAFIKCAFQSNTVGVFYDGLSIYPMQTNAFYSCLFQSNTLAGFAGFSAEDALEFNTCHFEANGSAGTTLSVDTRTVTKCAIQLDSAKASFVDCALSETANPCVILSNSATIRLNNSYGYGTSGGVFISGTLSENVEFYGYFNGLGLCKCHVARWPDTYSVGSNFSAIGAIVLKPSAIIDNTYVASTPTVPTLGNAVDATINADAGDVNIGIVSNVTFAASAGSTSSNRITIDVLPSGVATGDTIVISFLVKASASTLINFLITGGSHVSFTDCPVDTVWRRVLLTCTTTNNTAPLLYVYPTNSDATTVYFAMLHSFQVATGGDLTRLSEMVSQGLFNNNQNEFYYSAAPTVGTWKVGDRIWDTNPAAGATPGWVCTTAGNPGTWKAMANLAA